MSRVTKIGFMGILVLIGFLVIRSQTEVKSTVQGIDSDRVFSLLDASDGEEYDSPKGKKAVASAMAYVEKHGKTSYDFGKDLYSQGDAQRAILWCEALAIATDEPQYFYGRAYYEWGSGDTEAAIRDVNFLVQKPLPPLIEARTYYLRGRINLQSRFLEQAEGDFNLALKRYKSIDGKFGGQYLCLTLIARVAIAKKEYDRVGPLLEAAIVADKKNNGYYGMSLIYEMYGAMYFEQRDFQAALEANLKSRAAYLDKGRTSMAEGILVKIGLLEYINGDPKARVLN